MILLSLNFLQLIPHEIYFNFLYLLITVFPFPSNQQNSPDYSQHKHTNSHHLVYLLGLLR